MSTSDWTYESIWNKTKLYAERAIQQDRESALFPFWCSLSIELLGRATLSYIHPVLIADPREGSNILHAFGYGIAKGEPKTIGAKTVFLRLERIITEFTKIDEKFVISFINKRNIELHTGTPAFEGIKTSDWLTEYYKVAKVLLSFQEKNLEDLFGKEEAEIAEKMISEYDKELVSIVFDRIKKFKDVFNEQTEEIKESRIAENEKKHVEFLLKSPRGLLSKKMKCPSCEQEGILVGKYISSSEPIVEEDMISEKQNILPVEFHCFVCSFRLKSHGELSAIGEGGQFTLKKDFDPLEYYNIDPIEAAQDMGIDILEAAIDKGYDIDYYVSKFEEEDYGND